MNIIKLKTRENTSYLSLLSKDIIAVLGRKISSLFLIGRQGALSSSSVVKE